MLGSGSAVLLPAAGARGAGNNTTSLTVNNDSVLCVRCLRGISYVSFRGYPQPAGTCDISERMQAPSARPALKADSKVSSVQLIQTRPVRGTMPASFHRAVGVLHVTKSERFPATPSLSPHTSYSWATLSCIHAHTT